MISLPNAVSREIIFEKEFIAYPFHEQLGLVLQTLRYPQYQFGDPYPFMVIYIYNYRIQLARTICEIPGCIRCQRINTNELGEPEILQPLEIKIFWVNIAKARHIQVRCIAGGEC